MEGREGNMVMFELARRCFKLLGCIHNCAIVFRFIVVLQCFRREKEKGMMEERRIEERG